MPQPSDVKMHYRRPTNPTANEGSSSKSDTTHVAPKHGERPSRPPRPSQSSASDRKSKAPVSANVKLSKLLSWVLRHGAESEGIPISADGFVAVDDLLSHPKWKSYKLKDIQNVVDTNDKQRFLLRAEPVSETEEKWFIRANQGHSMKQLEVEMSQILNPDDLDIVVHGTYASRWKSIEQKGLSVMTRKHIHFATGIPTDQTKVISGMRSSCDLFIYVDVGRAMGDGIVFLRSANGVILTEGKDGCLAPKYFKQVVTSNGKVIQVGETNVGR